MTNQDKQSDFFIVRFRGGLGNQLFQYAAARIYSIASGRSLKADITGYANPEKQRVPRGYKLDKFNMEIDIANDEEVRVYKYPLGILSKIWRGIKQRILNINYLDYHPSLFQTHITYLDGYFQSPLYYTGHEDLIRSECSVKQEYISEKAKEIEKEMATCMSISLHIRRGDIVSETSVANTQGLCSVDYYEMAVANMRARLSDEPIFYVFSDDINWVKEYMHFPETTVYVSEFNLMDYEELYLMSKSKHNIIGNSTFSWWGAWLNSSAEKIVCAPKQWTVKNTEHPTIIPEGWLRL